MAKKSQEQKAADKARKQQLRALAAAATTLWIMGGGTDEIASLAVQAAMMAATDGVGPDKATQLADVFENLAVQLREVAERGDVGLTS